MISSMVSDRVFPIKMLVPQMHEQGLNYYFISLNVSASERKKSPRPLSRFTFQQN